MGFAALVIRLSRGADRWKIARKWPWRGWSCVGRESICSPTANLINLFLQQLGIGSRNLDCLYARVIAENEAQVGWPHHMLQEGAGGCCLFVQNPGHFGAGIEQDADVQFHVSMVGKEFDGLLPTILEDVKFLLVELAGQVLLVIAHGEVERDQVNILLEDILLIVAGVGAVSVLGEGNRRQAEINEREGQGNERHLHYPTHRFSFWLEVGT